MIKSHGLRDEIDFSALQISVRAKHCLVRNGIDTYSRMASLKQSDILAFKNAGTKTVEEIMSIIGDMEFEEMPVESFSVAEPVLEGLIDFVGMGISKRAENCLTQNGIDRLEFLLRMTADDIHKMPCAGAKTVMELMEIIAKLKQEAFFSQLRSWGLSKDACAWLEQEGVITMAGLLGSGCGVERWAESAITREISAFIEEVKLGGLDEKKRISMQLAERIGACFGECGHRLPDGVLEKFLAKVQLDLQQSCEILDRFVEEGQADIDRIIKEPAFGDWIATRAVTKSMLRGLLLEVLDTPFGKSLEAASVSLSEIVPRFLVKPKAVEGILDELEAIQ